MLTFGILRPGYTSVSSCMTWYLIWSSMVYILIIHLSIHRSILTPAVSTHVVYFMICQQQYCVAAKLF